MARARTRSIHHRGSNGSFAGWLVQQRWFRRAALYGLVVLLGALVIAGMNQYVAAQPQYRIDLGHVLPRDVSVTWVSGDGRALVIQSLNASLWAGLAADDALIDRKTLRRSPAEARRASLIDDELVPRIAAAYASSPWVAEVMGVRKAYPESLSVRFRLTRPRLAVPTDAGTVLVDGSGLVLPLIFPDANAFDEFNADCRPPLPLVSGVEGAPPTVGRAWAHSGVRAALSVAGELHRFDAAKAFRLTRIDASNVGGTRSATASEIVLYGRPTRVGYTGADIRVMWGRDPASAKYGERSPRAKVADLMRECAGANTSTRLDLRYTDS